jgi:hypothetical protein
MRQKAPAEAWKHFNGAAETKSTFHRNPRAFQQWLFRQKIFHDVSDPDISIELFGKTLPIPAITAPVGSFILFGKDAEREVAEGTDRAGAMMFVSQAAKFNLHNWRGADKSPLVFMAYMNRGKPEVEEYAKTAEDLGFAAVGITMDTVKPVKIGDEVPLSTKDGKPRKGSQVDAQRHRMDENDRQAPSGRKRHNGCGRCAGSGNFRRRCAGGFQSRRTHSGFQPLGLGSSPGSRRCRRRRSSGAPR